MPHAGLALREAGAERERRSRGEDEVWELRTMVHDLSVGVLTVVISDVDPQYANKNESYLPPLRS